MLNKYVAIIDSLFVFNDYPIDMADTSFNTFSVGVI